jgi:hypothetical protein
LNAGKNLLTAVFMLEMSARVAVRNVLLEVVEGTSDWQGF